MNWELTEGEFNMKKLRVILAVAMLASLVLSAYVAPAPAPAVEAGGEIAVIVKTGNSGFWKMFRPVLLPLRKS